MASTAKNAPGGKKTQGILIGLDKIGKPPASRCLGHRNQNKGKKQKTHATPPRKEGTNLDNVTEEDGGVDKMDGADMSLDLFSKVNDQAQCFTQETEFRPLQTQDLGKQFEQLNSLSGMHIAALGVFTDLPDNENNLRHGPIKESKGWCSCMAGGTPTESIKIQCFWLQATSQEGPRL